jgi:4-oxalmesaconate hydratase
MIIDIHGHYTTAPAEQQRFRVDQLAALDDPTLPPPAQPKISDDEIRKASSSTSSGYCVSVAGT